jgi:hypothetical protein
MMALERSFHIPRLTLTAQDPDSLALDSSVPVYVWQFYQLKQCEDALKIELLEFGEDAPVAMDSAQPAATVTDAAETEQLKLVDAAPAVSKTISRGKFCDKVINEVRRIKNLCLATGRRVAEIQNEHADWAVWKVRDSLSSEDRDTFNHPNQWGSVVGYAKNILVKTSGVSVHTITSQVKAYRKSQRPK